MHNDVQLSAMFFGKNFQNIPLFNSTQTAVKKFDSYGLKVFTFTGKERDSETGFSYFGARYYDSDILTGWLSVDPMSDKYPSLSLYAYCGGNPVRLVDPDGEEIDISALSENMQNRLVNSLCYITGLKLTINNGKIEYSKDNLGNAIFENGSVSARNDLIAAIEAKNKDGSNYVIEVGPHLSSKGGVNDNGLSGTIYLYWDLKERYDKQTNGIGMIFMHELGHAFFGDKDPEPDGRLRYALNGDIIDRRLGEAVTRVNKYRSELNLPIRATYIPNLEGYVPFLETIQSKNGKTKTREIYLWME